MEKDNKEEEYKELKKNEQISIGLINDLKQKAFKYEQLKIDKQENLEKLCKLYEMGVINEDGEFIYQNDEEKENIMS